LNFKIWLIIRKITKVVFHYEIISIIDRDIKNSKTYQRIYKLILLVLALLVSTTIIKWAFSIMKVVKTRSCNKMEDESLTNI